MNKKNKEKDLNAEEAADTEDGIPDMEMDDLLNDVILNLTFCKSGSSFELEIKLFNHNESNIYLKLKYDYDNAIGRSLRQKEFFA